MESIFSAKEFLLLMTQGFRLGIFCEFLYKYCAVLQRNC